MNKCFFVCVVKWVDCRADMVKANRLLPKVQVGSSECGKSTVRLRHSKIRKILFSSV